MSEQNNLGPGQCGADREVFERVWRRVMPEDRPDCPFTLYSEEAEPAAQTVEGREGAPVPSAGGAQGGAGPRAGGAGRRGRGGASGLYRRRAVRLADLPDPGPADTRREWTGADGDGG